MKKNNLYLTAFLGLFMFLLFSGNKCSHNDNMVTGRVFPAGMEVPMRDVSVMIKDRPETTVMTDGSGLFQIEVSSFPVELEFRKPSYRTQVLKVKKAADISVYMKPGR